MSGAGDAPPPPDVRDLLDRLALASGGAASTARPKPSYAFWNTQPVAQFGDAPPAAGAPPPPDGPIEGVKTPAQERQEPHPLPDAFSWSTVDVDEPAQLREVHELLSAHYVEDDDAGFRFAYSAAFLSWALRPPGWRADWHVGVRVAATGRLVAFISGVPAAMRVRGAGVPVAEINFLCVHKKLRQKRLAPLLIREVTRRVHLADVWQAVYTAGVVLPTPVAEAQYWHRSLNPKKLIAVGFSRLAPRMTLARTVKLYKLPAEPATPGVRPMTAADAPAVAALLEKYQRRFALAPALSEADVAHWLVHRPGVVHSYVVDRGAEHGGVTDLFSFYTLPSTVLGHPEHSPLVAAYMFYTVPATVPAAQLVGDALILAAATGHDVFNALDILENGPLLRDLKFGPGDGQLRYYLFNWRTERMAPGDVGLVML